MSETEKTSVSRRALLQTAAWTVPAVAVAAAAPTATASHHEPVDPSFTPGTFCKHPGGTKNYHAVFCFNNTTADAITINLTNMIVNGVSLTPNFSVNGSSQPTYQVPSNTEVCLYVDAGPADNSANGEATLYFNYLYNGNLYEGDVSTGTVNDLPPCSQIGQPDDEPPHPTSGPTP